MTAKKPTKKGTSSPPRIEYLEVQNFRALRDVEFKDLMATTHSPFFLNALRPQEVRVLWRDETGFTQTQRVSDVPGVAEFVEQGALLGHLWMEGQLGVGDPLVNFRCSNRFSPRRPEVTAQHLELLVEEPSMEVFLRALLPRLLPRERSFEVHPFQGKTDLLDKVAARLRAYAQWLPEDWRIVVVVDRDADDCLKLKQRWSAQDRCSAYARGRSRSAALQFAELHQVP